MAEMYWKGFFITYYLKNNVFFVLLPTTVFNTYPCLLFHWSKVNWKWMPADHGMLTDFFKSKCFEKAVDILLNVSAYKRGDRKTHTKVLR